MPIAEYFRRLVAARPAQPTGPQASNKAARAALRAERIAQKATADAERARRKAERAEQRAAAQRALDEASILAYDHYLRVREWARRVSAQDGGPALSALSYLWDLDRQMVAHLRRWCEPISGVRAADYDAPSELLIRRLQRDVMTLGNGRGTALLVSEPPVLGGFGVLRGGRRLNEDTLRWFAAALALEDGGVLGQFRASPRRQLVWEIGGGWGGFAYAFKTLCPNVTYLVTGVPERLLVSAVYLMTAFPHARCRFVEPGAAAPWGGWEDADFVFAPESALSSGRPAPIALTLDVMALREMDAAGIRAHVQHAYAGGSLYFYSMLPAVNAPDDARHVWDAIGRSYWLHPVPPRDINGVSFPPPAAPEGYVHLVGWRRMRA